MIIWINGAFGVGKTTTAEHLCALVPGSRRFDPEQVGFLLRAHLGGVDFDDFQDLPPWRALVPEVALQLSSTTGDDLVTVQTVLVEEYWTELARGLAARDLDVFHVVLHATALELRARIVADEREPTAVAWRLGHIEDYERASGWMRNAADLVVDTSGTTSAECAQTIAAAVGAARTSPLP